VGFGLINAQHAALFPEPNGGNFRRRDMSTQGESSGLAFKFSKFGNGTFKRCTANRK
jgi:hypothetical protein